MQCAPKFTELEKIYWFHFAIQGHSSSWLVTFSMPGNNTLETSDSPDQRFPFWSSKVVLLYPIVFLGEKNYCEAWNKWFRFFSPKASFSPALSLETDERKNSWEKKLWISYFIKYCIYQASFYIYRKTLLKT